MDLFLDGQGPVYRQVSRALRAAILSGRLPHDARLPASRDLARDLGVSRNTVVAAYEELRSEGLLSGKVGSGSYVRHVRPPQERVAPPPPPVPAQSAFMQRAREVHDPDEYPFGDRPAGMRHAFQFGYPVASRTLAATWAREIARAAPYVRLAYPERQGLAALRQAVSKHIGRTRGITCTADDVLVVYGAQQAFSLVADVLVDPGDEVAMEEPHYRAVRKVMQMHGATIVGVDVDAHGLRTDALPERPIKLVAVTPSHQFPTGAILSPARRHALLDYAQRVGGWIMEDDYDGEFRFGTTAVPALRSLDRAGRVVYVGTFSKTLSPASRLGFIIMPPALRDDFLTAKWASDLGCPPLEQIALARFIESGRYDRHLRQVARTLGERREVLVRALRELLGGQCTFDETHAGMHLLVRIEGFSAIDEAALVRRAAQRKLGIYPARVCYLAPHDACRLLMGFSTLPAREIRDAVLVLAHCIAEVRRERAGGAGPRSAAA